MQINTHKNQGLVDLGECSEIKKNSRKRAYPLVTRETEIQATEDEVLHSSVRIQLLAKQRMKTE